MYRWKDILTNGDGAIDYVVAGAKFYAWWKFLRPELRVSSNGSLLHRTLTVYDILDCVFFVVYSLVRYSIGVAAPTRTPHPYTVGLSTEP